MEHYQTDAGALEAEQTAQEQMQHEARERSTYPKLPQP